MSASLVGSEMCIRDSRCSERRLRTALVRVGRSIVSVTVSVAECSVRVKNCLLYTSDAADDM
eukprot:9110771-Alexandrium_andersonii.AAC.1